MQGHDGSSHIRWLVDTRNLWSDGLDGPEASRALGLLAPAERDAVRRYIHLRDAKMSLASRLLKRLVITQCCQVPWSDAIVGEGPFRKPCFTPKSKDAPGVAFNVSHQAGLVALLAHEDSTKRVGVDVVCVNERDDYRHIDKAGFSQWLHIYEEVFSAREMEDIQFDFEKLLLPDGRELSGNALKRLLRYDKRDLEVSLPLDSGETISVSSNIPVDTKLRHFYAYWCLKEAYVKMTGEALMATWLRDLEFRKVRNPVPAPAERIAGGARWGEKVTDIEVWRSGKRVQDVQIELEAFEHQYMVATAVSETRAVDCLVPDQSPHWLELDLQKDIYAAASSSAFEAVSS